MTQSSKNTKTKEQKHYILNKIISNLTAACHVFSMGDYEKDRLKSSKSSSHPDMCCMSHVSDRTIGQFI